MALRDVLPILSKLCRKLQYTTGKDLTIEHSNDHYQDCITQLDKVLNYEGDHLKNLPQFLNGTCGELDIGGGRELRGRLDCSQLADRIYKAFC